MTPYDITINWENDYILEEVIKREIKKYLERARFFKESNTTIRYELEILRELRSIVKQVRAHHNLSEW